MLSLRVVCSVLLLAVICSAQKKDDIKAGLEKKKTDDAPIGSISCYQCNSATSGQKDCALSDKDKLDQFKKPCKSIENGTLAGETAKMCRKILQNVGEEEERIIRECAYSDDELEGKKRTGNKGIILYLYQCKNENNDEPCNTASVLSYSMIAILTSFVLGVLRSRF